MPYLISETGQEMLQDTKRFCQLEIYGKSAAWDKDGQMPDETRELFRQMGYQIMTMPEEYGGLGLGSTDVAAILEEIAKADAGLAITMAGNNLALRAVLDAGTEEQKEKVCRLLADGRLGAVCLTESQAGSDAMNLQTKAAHQPDGSWVLNGTKQFVTNGSTADFYVVAAIPEDGDAGTDARIKDQLQCGRKTALALFLVEKGTAGLMTGQQENKLGIRSCDTCPVDLNDCQVPADALLGMPESIDEKHGTEAIFTALNEGRVFLAAMATGVAQRALEEAACYGKERIQFDRPVTDNQAIRFMLADMQIKIEAARQLTAYALQKMDAAMAADPKAGSAASKEFAAAAAMAKAFAADTAIEVTGKAMEIFGGCGYMTDFPAEKLLRDARVFQIIEGTGQMQRTLIADMLLGPVQAAVSAPVPTPKEALHGSLQQEGGAHGR